MSILTQSRSVALGAVAAAMLANAGAAHAVSITSNYLTVTATSGGNTATLIVPLTDNLLDSLPEVDAFNNIEVLPGQFFTGWDWRNGLNIEVRDPNTNVLLLTFLSLGTTAGRVDFDDNSPSRFGFDFDFSLVAGAGDVSVQVETGVLSFDPVLQSLGRSDVGATLTDSSGSAPGATATGGFANGMSFRALYDGTSIFREYLDFSVPFAVGEDQSDSRADNMIPAGSFQPVGSDVTSLQVQYSFNVSANDQFSSNGTWVIQPAAIPAPSVSLLGLATLGLLPSRRRR